MKETDNMENPIIAGAGVSNSGHQTPKSRNRKKLIILALTSTLLLVGAVVGIVAGVTNSKNSGEHSKAHAIVKSTCSSTLYPDLCFSTISEHEGSLKKVVNQKDVIELSIKITVKAVEESYFRVKKLTELKTITNRERIALHDCLETIDETLDELHEAIVDLHEYPNKKSLNEHADDLKTLLSSAITNQVRSLNNTHFKLFSKQQNFFE